MPADFEKEDAPKPKAGGIIADRRLWTDAEKKRMLEEGSPNAAFLLAAEGDEIPAETVKSMDLELVGGKVKQHGHKAEEFEPVKAAAKKTTAKKKSARKGK